jgi:hypothetical protein
MEGSQLSVLMCPEHNDIPEGCGERQLPERYWDLRTCRVSGKWLVHSWLG